MTDQTDQKPHRRAVLAGSALAALGAAANASCAQTIGANGKLKVAVLVDQASTLIDFAGLWQALANAWAAKVPGFSLYTVAPTMAPITASGILVTPDFSYANAPAPDILAMGAQGGYNDAKRDWILKVNATTKVTASVCTGAFILAKAGLLDGLQATTHHKFYDQLEQAFPKVHVVRGRRIVDQGHIVTAGGESCCIDLGLWLIDKFYGRQAALAAADETEYEGLSWQT